MRIKVKCGGVGDNARTMNVDVQDGVAAFNEVLAIIVQMEDGPAGTGTVAEKLCKLQVHEVTGPTSSESLTKLATLEFDLATIIHTNDIASPRSHCDGVSMDMALPNGGSLAVNIRVRLVPGAADENEEHVVSERGALDSDILFWGKDGQPYNEAADWEAAGGSGGLTLEQLVAASGEVASAENDDLRIRIRELEDENFVLSDELSAVKRRQERGGKDTDKMKAKNEELQRLVDKLTQEKSGMEYKLRGLQSVSPEQNRSLASGRRGSGGSPAGARATGRRGPDAAPAAPAAVAPTDDGELNMLKAKIEEMELSHAQLSERLEEEVSARERLALQCECLTKEKVSRLCRTPEILHPKLR